MTWKQIKMTWKAIFLIFQSKIPARIIFFSKWQKFSSFHLKFLQCAFAHFSRARSVGLEDKQTCTDVGIGKMQCGNYTLLFLNHTKRKRPTEKASHRESVPRRKRPTTEKASRDAFSVVELINYSPRN